MPHTPPCHHDNPYEFTPGQWECHDCGEVIGPPADVDVPAESCTSLPGSAGRP